MDAGETHLIIVKPGSRQQDFFRSIASEKGTHIFPLWWLFTRKLVRATLVDEKCQIFTITGASIDSVASRERFGSESVFGHIAMLAFSTILLSVPVEVRFSVEPFEVADLSEVKRLVLKLVKGSRKYSGVDASSLEAQIADASSVKDIANTIAQY